MTFVFGSTGSRALPRVVILLLGSALLPVAGAHAGVIMSAQAVISAPSVVGGYTFDRTIDQSGLTTGYTSGVTDFDSYVALAPTHERSNSPPNYAASFRAAPFNVDFDLGSTQTIEQLAFWNFPFSSLGPVLAFEVITSSSSDFSNPFSAGSFVPVNDGNDSINTVQAFDLADSTARYVRFRVTRNDGSGTGFSEIAFGVSPATVVPEPSTLVLGGSAVVLMVLARARRRQSAA